jgi:hypothetical protein
MKTVCVTDEWSRKYLELCEARELAYKPWLSRMAVYVVEKGTMVCGVQVYDTTGPFLFFEHLVTNPDVSPRERYAAVSFLIEEGMNMCRMFGKYPQVVVRHGGIKNLLKKHGFFHPGTILMTCELSNLEKNDEEPVYAHKFARSVARAAPTEPSPAGDPEEHLGVYAAVLGGAVPA